jgi:type II secretory pathway pseudopilin PulG
MKLQRGFSYLIALFVVAMIAVFSLRAIEDTLTRERRAQEEELLYVGMAYRTAIKKYYEGTPGFVKRYPSELSTLTLDSRGTRLSRPLRKVFRDPIENSGDWGILRAADGGVMGVYSLSDKEPMKKSNFPPELEGFSGAQSYRSWRFTYVPKR